MVSCISNSPKVSLGYLRRVGPRNLCSKDLHIRQPAHTRIKQHSNCSVIVEGTSVADVFIFLNSPKTRDGTRMHGHDNNPHTRSDEQQQQHPA
uniref:Uncharacterized protein n=1 Tax=Trichogramma kaykai TaxID=54128 RepID=A0ABD2XEI7_9HYME